MPLIPMIPPVPVPIAGGFDYVAVDAAHRRVYAAHTGASSLLIVDADKGTIIKQITVGPMHGVAYNAAGTKVYTGNGDSHSVSESDPSTFAVLRTAAVPGPVDAIAFDEENGHIYADEDDGTRVFVIDAKTMQQIGTVQLPGHKPEYLVVDPTTHTLYQNIADLSEIVAIDPNSLQVTATFKTPELSSNHPLQYDIAFKQIVSGGANGVLSVYDTAGHKKFQTTMPAHIDQCDLDQGTHMLACAGGGAVTVFQLAQDAAPVMVGAVPIAPHVHTVAFDQRTHNFWAVWSTGTPEGGGGAAFIERFSVSP